MSNTNYLPINGKKSKYGIKLSGKTDDVIKALQSITNDKGYFNLEVLERKQPGKYGETHYVKEDTWQPDPSKAPPKKAPDFENAELGTIPEDDLPF